jgi:hypothetical protein
MTTSERESAKAMLGRQRAGWAYMAQERKTMLRSTVTKDAVLAFQTSFEYAQTLPPRLESGLVEFYVVLARGRR